MSDTNGVWSDGGHQQGQVAESTLELWRAAAGRAELPRLADIRVRYDGDGWEHRFLLIEDPDPLSSVFILCGASVREGFGGAVVGRSLAEAVPPGGRDLIEACVTALRERVPVQVVGSFAPREGTQTVYRATFLPVRGEPGSPRYVLGTFGWRREPLANGHAGGR